jgi:prophage maintenance system killer protein
MERKRKFITEPEYIEVNKRENELSSQKQTNFKREVIRSILKEVNSQEDPSIAGMILYYRTVYDHPFRGANRRTAVVTTGMILNKNKIPFKFPVIGELEILNQRIRDGRVSRKEFEEIYTRKILTKK